MKMVITLICLTIGFSAFATNSGSPSYGTLTLEDQKYYKNESNAGQNQFERIESLVKETNKLHGKIKSMEDDIAILKKEIATLKERK